MKTTWPVLFLLPLFLSFLSSSPSSSYLTMEIHRCRFVEHLPSGVNTLALNGDSSLLAVGRSNASIEIWNIRHDWILEKTIPGGENLSVEALVWTKEGRLFSAGHHATITEWDLVHLRSKVSVDSFGGAVWSLALNDSGTTLAAACEDGCVRLFDLLDGTLVYKKSLVGDKARILSLSWQPKSNFVVTGSSEGVIRRWNTVTGLSPLSVHSLRVWRFLTCLVVAS